MLGTLFHWRPLSNWKEPTTTTKHRVTIPCKRSFDFTWNPYEIHQISWNLYEICQISWNPYEIHWISWNPYEICWISWNPYEIWRISCEIHPNWRVFAETSEFIRFWVDFTWNPPDFRWNPPDFKLWAFVWWSSIGLSTFERPNRTVYTSFNLLFSCSNFRVQHGKLP